MQERQQSVVRNIQRENLISILTKRQRLFVVCVCVCVTADWRATLLDVYINHNDNNNNNQLIQSSQNKNNKFICFSEKQETQFQLTECHKSRQTNVVDSSRLLE